MNRRPFLAHLSFRTWCVALVLVAGIGVILFLMWQARAAPDVAITAPDVSPTPVAPSTTPIPFPSQGSEPEQVVSAGERELTSAEIFAWARENPRAAVAWAQALPDGAAKESALENVARGWATVAPREALDFAQSQVAARISEKLTAAIVSVWARTELANAQQWITSVPEGSIRSAAVLALVDVLAPRHPPATMSWLEQLPKGEARDAGISQALGAWARKDAAAALTWAEKADIGDPRLQNELVFSALSDLVQQDAQRAADWAKALPPSPERDEAVQLLTQALMEEHPADAFLWASSIQDDHVRRRQSAAVLQYWLEADADAARAALQAMLNSPSASADSALRTELAQILAEAEKSGTDPEE